MRQMSRWYRTHSQKLRLRLRPSLVKTTLILSLSAIHNLLFFGLAIHATQSTTSVQLAQKVVALSQVTQLKNGGTALKKTMMSLIAAEMATKLLKLK